jgi:hypothetical protein
MKKSFSTPWTREFFANLFIYFSFCRLAQSVLLFCFFSSDNEDPKKYAATAPTVDAPVINEPPSQEATVVPNSLEAATKKAGSRASKRLKKASTPSTSLDAPRPVISTDDVSAICFRCLLALNCSSHALLWTDFDEKVRLFGY